MTKDKEYTEFLISIETALHQISQGKCKCYTGKYDGKKGEIEINIKRNTPISENKKKCPKCNADVKEIGDKHWICTKCDGEWED